MTRVQRRAAQRQRARLSFGALVGAMFLLLAALLVWRLDLLSGEKPVRRTASGILGPIGPQLPVAAPSPSVSPTPEGPEPINTGVEGLTTFRGNATRTYYGEGPVPRNPEILWRYPGTGGLCRESTDKGITKVWCGTGWTGQPNVVEWKGKTQVRFGAYDGAVHVVDAETGRDRKEPFPTDDIIKGTVTSDPDGFPLLYSGSRDNYFRVLALDRGRSMEELWKIHADSAPRRVWNDDWDSSALVIDDYLLVGGENSWFYVIKLNRRYDDAGKVQVAPEVRVTIPGFDDRLFRDLGDDEVSIENSPAFRNGVVYFANSGGLVQGWDISDVLAGGKRHDRVFRYWTGEDTDASVVIDDEGYLYVASELERFNARSREAGQFMKLDPRKPKDPVVWKKNIGGNGGTGGAWATPGIHGDTVYLTTHTGRVLGVDRQTGKRRWQVRLHPPTWTSPVIVDDVLIVGDCEGYLHAFDVSDPTRRPPRLWRLKLEGCIEATPAVWRGKIFVGSRGGAVYGIGDPS